MNYTGNLYGKIGRKHVPLRLTSADVDKMERDLSDAMKNVEVIAESHKWCSLRLEKAEAAVRQALAQLDDIRTDDLAELRMHSVATAVSKARVALRLAKMEPLPEHLRGSETRGRIPCAMPPENDKDLARRALDSE